MPKITAQQMRSNHVVKPAACRGCGANLSREPVEHRPDCTVEPSPLICDVCDAIRLPSEARDALRLGKLWQFIPSPYPGRYLCPDHHQKRNTP
ncbi:hypothetical protein SEA_CAMBIARE_48 [Mycobacterium phage Cambiare]|uniref:Uncharacterized protein n=1 Tax=Mycobacterium phage Cambiare TaxID=1647305 RepID=A0A0F6WEC8_9CAUD|nr:hypothetical protein AVT48_gp48 [Mycobacterium phage Cambiare]AKF14550.1 hypothetical protein SEA_CAMBIARE_48 [Mycobacterium phage Cambiare]